MAGLLPVGVFVYLLRETLEADHFYSNLWLEGEVTDLSRSAAGHAYFTLRDDDGALKCVLFRNQALRQHQLPRIGESVAVHGGLSMYPRSGSMQLVVDLVRPAGLGAAQLELDYLREMLASEGLFDQDRKRALPAWPRLIGVVTSPHGAAWHDIQTVVGRRYPLAELVLAPANVQGLGAAESIVAALHRLQAETLVDVVILARGGGDSDDLSAFNDERVVRAVFACGVPVIAGIGHATDQTLVEDVADAFAATPSAAAEICVPSVIEIEDHLDALLARLTWSFGAQRAEAWHNFAGLSKRLAARNPCALLESQRTALNGQISALDRSTRATLRDARRQIDSTTKLLTMLDPHAVLARGYAVLSDPSSGRAIGSAAQVDVDARITITLVDGRIQATTNSVTLQNNSDSPRW
jgi:exodeoxyribonuclease VII large subunit